MKKYLFFFSLLLFSSLYSELATLTLGTPTTLSTGATGTIPRAAASESGDLIAVWVEDTPGPGRTIASSTFRNGTWSPFILVPNPLSHVQLAPSVAIDGSGNAVVTWVDSTIQKIAASTLSAGGNAWSTPTVISAGTSDVSDRVVSSPDGTTGASWVDFSAHTISFAQLLNFTTNTWGPPELVTTFTSEQHQLYIDPFDTFFETYTFQDFSTANVARRIPPWTNYPPFAGAGANELRLDFDAQGNAIAVWYDTIGGTIKSSTLQHGALNWSTPQFVQPMNTGVFSVPKIGVNADGYAVAIWPQFDGSITSIFSSIYSPITQTWSTPFAVNPGEDISLFPPPDLGMDAFGNAVAVWTDTSDVIKLGFLPFGSTTWQVSTISLLDNVDGAQVDVSENGNVVVTWIAGTSPPFTIRALNGSISQPPPPPVNPEPPASLTGRKRENRFAFQSEFFNVLEWTASPSPDVVAYRIYQNGVLIAEVPSNVFTYRIQRVSPNQRITYGVSAVNAAGHESTQRTITL